jgi:hypothetical protein
MMNWDIIGQLLYMQGATVHRALPVGSEGTRAEIVAHLERRKLFGSTTLSCFFLNDHGRPELRIRDARACIEYSDFAPRAAVVILLADCDPAHIPALAHAVHADPTITPRHAPVLVGALTPPFTYHRPVPVGTPTARTEDIRTELNGALAYVRQSLLQERDEAAKEERETG